MAFHKFRTGKVFKNILVVLDDFRELLLKKLSTFAYNFRHIFQVIAFKKMYVHVFSNQIVVFID